MSMHFKYKNIVINDPKSIALVFFSIKKKRNAVINTLYVYLNQRKTNKQTEAKNGQILPFPKKKKKTFFIVVVIVDIVLIFIT